MEFTETVSLAHGANQTDHADILGNLSAAASAVIEELRQLIEDEAPAADEFRNAAAGIISQVTAALQAANLCTRAKQQREDAAAGCLEMKERTASYLRKKAEELTPSGGTVTADTALYRCGHPALQAFLAANGYRTIPTSNSYGKPFPLWLVPLDQEGAAECILNWLSSNNKLRENTEAFLRRVIEEGRCHD